MAEAPRSFDLVGFTLIVDDIVLPHGETVMEVLGGGGPQTLFGYQLVASGTARLALSAGVGPDLPQRCKDWLRSIGADASGLVLHPRPTPRAWQVFEEWGRRTQIWRGRDDPCDALYDMLRPTFTTMPPALRQSANYHLGLHPLHPPRRLMRALRAAAHTHGGVLSVEPYTAAEEAATPGQVAELLSYCDVFSPNEDEAASIVGAGPPDQLAARLLQLSPPGGADVVVVRCGPRGVLVARRPPTAVAAAALNSGASTRSCEAFEAWEVPAVADTRVVDVTGCGNAFCGGFLAALSGGVGGATDRPATVAAETTAALAAAAAAAASPTAADAASASTSASSLGSDSEHHQDSTPSCPPAWLHDADLAVAGAWGCVAASFMAEERGVPITPIPRLQERAQRRFTALLPRVRPRALRPLSSVRAVAAPSAVAAAVGARSVRMAGQHRVMRSV